jgi:3,5-epimerase/4-reductase
LASIYPSTLILRLRLPISDDLHPRCLITKITSYKRVINVPNSVTVLHDLLPLAVALALHNESGIYNFTNPGAISHNELLELYREYIDPSFVWENFTVEEMRHVVVAERSNCALDVTKLVTKGAELGISVPEAHDAVRASFARSKAVSE